MIEAMMGDSLRPTVEQHGLSRSGLRSIGAADVGGRSRWREPMEGIYARSGGNTVFVEELVDEMHDRGEHGRAPMNVRAGAVDRTVSGMLALAALPSAPEISPDERSAAAAAREPPVSDAAAFNAPDRALQMRLLQERASSCEDRHRLDRSAIFEDVTRYRRGRPRGALGPARSDSALQPRIGAAA